MQTLIQVITKGKGSLREAIAQHAKLEDYHLEVTEHKRQSRADGWTKVVSTRGLNGAINLEWHSAAKLLICRVVNKGKGKPDSITGDFVDYLFACHRKRIQAVQIVPR